jgi:hypothetical protein
MLATKEELSLLIEVQPVGLEANVFYGFIGEGSDFEASTKRVFDGQGLTSIASDGVRLAIEMQVFHTECQPNYVQYYCKFKHWSSL